ncbi:hypothetical protein CANCADRAFT_30060, partial [Tortispora caseinolytica NRRL Y-17796]
MFCAISGNPPKSPVFSPASGSIFDRSLIENYIQLNGVDPVSQKPLSVDDLLPVNTSAGIATKPPDTLSIPSLLDSLAKEYDANALETFSLRKQLQE